MRLRKNHISLPVNYCLHQLDMKAGMEQWMINTQNHHIFTPDYLFVSPLICLAEFMVTEMQLSIHLVMFDTSLEVNGGILQPNADFIADLAAAAAASRPSCEQSTVLVLLIRQPQRPAKDPETGAFLEFWHRSNTDWLWATPSKFVFSSDDSWFLTPITAWLVGFLPSDDLLGMVN